MECHTDAPPVFMQTQTLLFAFDKLLACCCSACYRQDAHECIEKHTQMPTYMEQRALIIQQNLREGKLHLSFQ